MSPCAWLAVPAGTASVSDHASSEGGFTGGFDHVPLRLARRPSWERLGGRSHIFRRGLHWWLLPCPLAPGSPSQLGPPRCPITHLQKAASRVASTMSPCAWLAVPAG